MISKPPEAGSNFRPAFFFLSRKQKKALSAVYAYCRRVDDIVDIPGNNDPADSINFWREEIGRLYQGKPACAISKNLLPAVSEYGLQKQDFLLILDGVEKDITVSRYETFADLEHYLYRVACAVGLLCVKIFGYDHSSAKDYAKWLGYAVQMTNILRDVSPDAARGRIYLPMEDLQRFNCSVNDIKNRVYSRPFVELMRFEAGRAHGFYEKARQVLQPDYKRKMLPALVMSEIYRGLLSKMERLNFDVLNAKISLGLPEKLGSVIKAVSHAWLQ